MKKRVLITGGAGFIAHHTIKHILDKTDWDVVSLDRLDFLINPIIFDPRSILIPFSSLLQ